MGEEGQRSLVAEGGDAGDGDRSLLGGGGKVGDHGGGVRAHEGGGGAKGGDGVRKHCFGQEGLRGEGGQHPMHAAIETANQQIIGEIG